MIISHFVIPRGFAPWDKKMTPSGLAISIFSNVCGHPLSIHLIFCILDMVEQMDNITLNVTSLDNVNPTNPITFDEPDIQSGVLRKFIGLHLDPNTHYSISILVNNDWLEIGKSVKFTKICRENKP